MSACRQFYPSVRSAKVITDAATGRSKGYGFVRFTCVPGWRRVCRLAFVAFGVVGSGPRVATCTKRPLVQQ